MIFSLSVATEVEKLFDIEQKERQKRGKNEVITLEPRAKRGSAYELCLEHKVLGKQIYNYSESSFTTNNNKSVRVTDYKFIQSVHYRSLASAMVCVELLSFKIVACICHTVTVELKIPMALGLGSLILSTPLIAFPKNLKL